MSKGVVFTMGVMSGTIAVLLLVLVLKSPYAPPVYGQAASGSGDITLATGGTGAQLNDLCWVLKKASNGDLQLALYWFQNGRTLQFVASRNISYEMDPIMLDGAAQTFSNKPSASDIKKMVQDAYKKKAEDDKKREEEDKKRKDGDNR